MRLRKRLGAEDAGKKIVELKDRSGRLGIEKGLIVGAPVSPGKKPVVIPDKRAERRQAYPGARAPLSRKKDASLLRREDYADIYQVGRRVSSMQKVSGRMRKGAYAGSPAARTPRTYGKPFGRLPLAQQGGACPTGAAPAAPAAPAVRQKGFNVRRLIASSACALIVAAAAFGAISTMQPHTALAEGQELYFDGRMLGIVQSQSDVDQAVQQIQGELKSDYGMDVQQGGQITLSPVACDIQNIMGETQVVEALKGSMDVKVVASVITVNGRAAVALKTASEAQQALDDVLAPYRNVPASLYRSDITFDEDVQVKEMPVDYGLVQPVDEAVHTLTVGSVEDNPYTVKKGDTLAKIANDFKLKISDLRTANPEIASTDVIQLGQTINAVQPQGWVIVDYTQQEQRQEAQPFKIDTEPDDTMYTTQSQVKQAGKMGQSVVWAKVTYKNGIKAQEEIISQTVVTPAQDEILLQGTKKMPANSGGTASLSSGKFIVPLKYAYRISSPFGPRNLAGAASDFHYGVDLAAPTGTPIYASAAGTVVFSGSASGYGLVVYIDHSGGFQTRYGHCSRLLVKKGQQVSQGQLIALVGATGDATGPHLHFEMRLNGVAVNPTKYVKL